MGGVVKKVAILGSTGSIGTNALWVISKFQQHFEVVGLTADKNVDLLEKQVRQFNPKIVCLADEEKTGILAERLKGYPGEVVGGQAGLIKVACQADVDLVICAIVGSAGLIPLLEAIKAKKQIGLANKEALVMAGRIVMELARQNGVKILPLDSEHNAIFQCLEGKAPGTVKKIILTGSGGPFRQRMDLETITLEETLKHPTWQMGKKITVDSATLMNKGLEVIEAHYLFDIPVSDITVVIHPQSIIHSMVEFVDGSILAQMSVTDMRIPIAYALSYPERLAGVLSGLNLTQIGMLSFQEPDLDKFPCLSYSYEAVTKGGTGPAVLNAANEIAVQQFLNKEIKFTDIPKIIKKVMGTHKIIESPTLDEILMADTWAREKARNIIKN
ncbi:MAG: 1-deoxy-D-xylulose-5-phosphate reductoisomerase [bacterium]|nr:1-deoxy-D-xylulose-5-phosphate reductoisomerase [bacterium]